MAAIVADYKQRSTCPYCWVEFKGPRGLGGHNKACLNFSPKKQKQQQKQKKQHLDLLPQWKVKGKRSTLEAHFSPFTALEWYQEEEEVLVPPPSEKFLIEYHHPTLPPLPLLLPYARKEDDVPLIKRYECRTCDKSYTCFQALGGHIARSGHQKKRKNKKQQLSAAAASSLTNQSQELVSLTIGSNNLPESMGTQQPINVAPIKMLLPDLNMPSCDEDYY